MDDIKGLLENDDSGPVRLCMWKHFLNIKDAQWVAPVNHFKHAPFASTWENFARPNMLIELPVPNLSPECVNDVRWIGTIKGFAGYKARVAYYPPVTASNPREPSPPLSTWVHFCSNIVKPFNPLEENNVILHPPQGTIPETENLEDVVVRTLQSILFREDTPPPDTIKDNHTDLIHSEVDRCSNRFVVGEIVEVIDKRDCSIYRYAQVMSIVGDRLNVKYFNEKGDDCGFWFSVHSHHIHKMGWCKAVKAPLRFRKPKKFFFPKNAPFVDSNGLNLPSIPPGFEIKEQMIFEMRHPIKPHKICPGYVVKVLRHGYFIAGTDWTKKNELVEIVLHLSTDYVLPLGFCRTHKIPMDMPTDAYSQEDEDNKGNYYEFSWKKYLLKTKLKELNTSSIPKGPNKFVKGSKLEAIYITNPRDIRPATVVQVAGRLLKLQFDGYTRQDPRTFQWVSCDSSNIYPLGYAEMVNHKNYGNPSKPRYIDHIQGISKNTSK